MDKVREKLRLKQSVCGISLRFGAKIIGSCQAFSSATRLLIILDTDNLKLQKAVSYVPADYDDDRENTITEIIYVIMFAITLHYLIVSILLVYGAMKDKSSFVSPWLTSNITVVIFAIIKQVLLLFSSLPVFFYLLTTVFDLGLPVYFHLIVYSYYKDLKEAQAAEVEEKQIVDQGQENQGYESTQNYDTTQIPIETQHFSVAQSGNY